MPELHHLEQPDAASAACRHYHLMAELRRAAGIAIFGCLTIAPVMWFVGQATGRDPLALAILVTLVLLGALWLSQYFLPRLKLDHTGIHRRILWWWDPWQWESFTSGQIRDSAALHSYVDPNRPWWRRNLQLGYLEQSDAKTINDLIRRLWLPPVPQPLPDQLEVKINWADSRIIQMSSDRIVISKGNTRSVYTLEDVSSITLWRLTHDRQDFRELHLQLPNQLVTLRRYENQGQECLNWRGHSPEVIAGFIHQYFAPDKIRDFSLHDAPLSLEELNARQERDKAQFMEARTPMKWSLRAAWGLLATMPFLFPWPKGLIMAGVYLPMMFAMHWIQREHILRYQKRLREHEAYRIALLAEPDSSIDSEPAFLHHATLYTHNSTRFETDTAQAVR